MYFTFTTMSTVGFGDFHPMNDFERLQCIFIFIFGLMGFPIIIKDIINMIYIWKQYNNYNNDAHSNCIHANLLAFFSVI